MHLLFLEEDFPKKCFQVDDNVIDIPCIVVPIFIVFLMAPQMGPGSPAVVQRRLAMTVGFGPRSISTLVAGLKTFCSNWPESAGHRPTAWGDSTTKESIHEGLDELDELF